MGVATMPAPAFAPARVGPSGPAAIALIAMGLPGRVARGAAALQAAAAIAISKGGDGVLRRRFRTCGGERTARTVSCRSAEPWMKGGLGGLRLARAARPLFGGGKA